MIPFEIILAAGSDRIGLRIRRAVLVEFTEQFTVDDAT
jgi:hypothetical protein